MGFNIGANDYSILKQSYIKKYIKLYLLNFQLNIVDEISGDLIGLEVSIDANSDLRRSCTVNLVVRNSSFDIQPGGKIWLDKYIQPYIGYENIHTKEIQWYNQGTYLINAPSFSYDGASRTLQLQGLDMMSKLTGLRNGNLPGIPTVITTGSNVRQAIIATLKLANMNKYIVSECVNTDGTIQNVPYDITINQGGTIYNILSELRDILPQYQMYFDVDGVFHYEQIPFGYDAPIILDDDILSRITTSESVDTDFESVKNYIEVYGRSHDVQHYSSTATVSGGNIRLTYGSITESTIKANTMIGFTLTADVNAPATIGINNISGFHKLVDENGVQIKTLKANEYYVAVYQSNNTWLFLGHNQAQAIASDTNPDSPFDINSDIGIIRIALYGGEYDNIMSDNLAKQRADIELYWRCRLNDAMSLGCIPIPWLDVNYIISYTLSNQAVTDKYMIQSIKADYGESNSMTITTSKYYPYYKEG